MRGLSRKKQCFSRSRILSCGIVLCLICGILSACSKNSFNKKKIDVTELARLVVDSLSEKTDMESLYERIPEEQRDGLSYSMYYEYIDVLSKMMPNGSKVVSFDIVEGEERQKLLDSMLSSDSEEYKNLISCCVPIRVETTGARVSGVPLYFYLQTNSEGEVYLDKEWAESCIDLYAFAVHYFEAYSNENLTDVISLLPYTETPEPLPQSRDVLKAKAKEMIRFYSHNVKSSVSQYEMISIDASNLLYLQPEVLNTQLQANSRTVYFRSDEDNVISVVDPIQNELKTVDLYLYYNGQRTVRVGEHAAPSQLENLFGTPISISCGPVMEKSQNGEELRNILVRYDGFVITVYGTYEDAENWDGRYVRFRIWNSSRVSIGSEMDVSDTSFDILTRYPFADETGFVLPVTADGEQYVLTFELDRQSANTDGSHKLKEIILSWDKDGD